MVKTIKELALEAYPIKRVKTYGYLPGGDITEKDENLPMRIAMEEGINAILDEVELIVTNPKLFDEERVCETEMLIKQLRR